MNKYMDDYQEGVIGEIANISMGNSATTLSVMVNQKVDITTPTISVINRSQALDDYEKTCIFVQIHYVKGLEGNNVLILKEEDVKIMTDLMMGGDGHGTFATGDLSEMHISAVSEAMNQMMGTAATSLSTLLKRDVDISTPQTNSIDVESVKIFEKMFEEPEDAFVKISFRLQIGEVMDSIMVQLYPIHFAVDMINLFPK